MFLDFDKKNVKNPKKRTGRPTQPVVSQATYRSNFTITRAMLNYACEAGEAGKAASHA